MHPDGWEENIRNGLAPVNTEQQIASLLITR
jgi:hypothetical protein